MKQGCSSLILCIRLNNLYRCFLFAGVFVGRIQKHCPRQNKATALQAVQAYICAKDKVGGVVSLQGKMHTFMIKNCGFRLNLRIIVEQRGLLTCFRFRFIFSLSWLLGCMRGVFYQHQSLNTEILYSLTSFQVPSPSDPGDVQYSSDFFPE